MSQSPVDRYMNDPTYKRVVDMFEHIIHTAQLTPSEVREAAVLACINYENKRVRAYHIPLTPELHADLERLHIMVNEGKP